jgi:hypothetical protein
MAKAKISMVIMAISNGVSVSIIMKIMSGVMKANRKQHINGVMAKMSANNHQ